MVEFVPVAKWVGVRELTGRSRLKRSVFSLRNCELFSVLYRLSVISKLKVNSSHFVLGFSSTKWASQWASQWARALAKRARPDVSIQIFIEVANRCVQFGKWLRLHAFPSPPTPQPVSAKISMIFSDTIFESLYLNANSKFRRTASDSWSGVEIYN